MIKVRLLPEENIKVRLTPPQGVKVGLKTTYLYDNTLIDDEVQLAKDWAIKMDGKVVEEGEEVDYSAKYYAGEAKTSETNAQIWAEGTDEEVATLEGEHSAKGWAKVAEDLVDTIDLSPYRTASDQDIIDEGKQDAIEDLDDIRSGAALGDTAIQPNDNVSELVNDAGYITSADVGNATLTIQKNSTTIDTFTANASVDKTINITVPTQASDVGALPDTTSIPANTSDLNNDSGFITGIDSSDVTTALGFTPADSSSLAAVATSGQYSDLTGTPTIPTVNNPTITITQGGVTKGSFTLNQASGDTIALDAGGGSSLPSQRGEDLTLGATGSTYTAPVNGGFVINKTSGGSGLRLALINQTSGIQYSIFSTGNGQALALSIPAAKGDVVEVRYTVSAATNYFRFVYAKGET